MNAPVSPAWGPDEADLEDVTWVAADGIRYLSPEVALLFKARQMRPKDQIDFANAWLMSTGRRTWLREAVHRTYGPDHGWAERLAAAD